MMCVKLTLPPRARRRWLLITTRLSNSSLAGTARTLGAGGAGRDCSLLAATRAAAPRNGGAAPAGFSAAGLAASAGLASAVGLAAPAGLASAVGLASVLGFASPVGAAWPDGFPSGDSVAVGGVVGWVGSAGRA